MRVLLLAYHFPPDPAVGSLRAANVARAFRDAGHDVHVITACRDDEEAGIRVGDGMTVETVRPLPGVREVYAAVKRRIRRSRNGAGAAAAGVSDDELPSSVPRWKRFVSSLIWLPDDRQGFIPPAARAARRVIRSGVTLLYTTAPPFSTHLIGLLLKRRGSALRWCLELRDPWTDNPWKPWHVRSRASDAAERRLERRCLESADHIVAVSDGVFDALRRRDGGAYERKVVLARNGIPRLLEANRPDAARRPFRISYAGSFYHGRDPMPFLRALSAVVRRRSLDGTAVRVCFAGECRWFRGRSIEEEARALGLADIVEFRDWIPHDECQRLVLESDLLLLLAQDQPMQIPNKLYEYLGARRPILAFVDAEGESATMLRQIGGHYVLDGRSAEACEQSLVDAMAHAAGAEGGRSSTPASERLLLDWTTSSQMAHLLSTVAR